MPAADAGPIVNLPLLITDTAIYNKYTHTHTNTILTPIFQLNLAWRNFPHLHGSLGSILATYINHHPKGYWSRTRYPFCHSTNSLKTQRHNNGGNNV